MPGISTLPQEIIFDILSRLPAKSLCQLRCVSKPWLSVLTNSNFIKTHLMKIPKEENTIYLSSPSRTLHALSPVLVSGPIDNSLPLPGELNFPPQLDRKWIEIDGSCNGLVLALNGDLNEDTDGDIYGDNKLILMNPTTLEQKQVPNSPFALDPRACSSMHGFGYDEATDDYKIVKLSYNYNPCRAREPAEIIETFVDVYILRENSWRRLEISPYDHSVTQCAPGPFLHGAIHWLASKKSFHNSSVIVAFDLTSERFREVPAPKDLAEEEFVFYQLISLKGCLGMIKEQHREEGLSVWMMKEYGVEESWSLIMRFTESGIELEGEMFPLNECKGETIRSLLTDGSPGMLLDRTCWTFARTLVSPNLNYSDLKTEHQKIS